jgi:hypothetical protein
MPSTVSPTTGEAAQDIGHPGIGVRDSALRSLTTKKLDL